MKIKIIALKDKELEFVYSGHMEGCSSDFIEVHTLLTPKGKEVSIPEKAAHAIQMNSGNVNIIESCELPRK